MTSALCEPADLYDFGLPRGNLPNPGRLVSTVYTSTNILELEGHGFRADAELLFRAEEGGSIPSPLVAGTTYYAIPLTDSTFQVAATQGGSAIDLTTAGESVVVVTPLSTQRVIEFVSAMIEEMLPSHVVPLGEPFPATVRGVCAHLSAQYMMQATGVSSVNWNALAMESREVLQRWARGVPIRGAVVPPASNLAVARTVGGNTSARRWDSCGGRIP
jgi:hypothetical protein